MSAWIAIISVGAWVGVALACRALRNNPRAEVMGGLAWAAVRAYAHVVHRVRFEGLENVPRWKPGEPSVGPLVIVSNHTAGIDPLLIHAGCEFNIRWMMMRGMMVRRFDALWDWLRIIAVEQDGKDSSALREGMRELKSGGVLGVFAEGGLERPAGTIATYQPGVGLLVLRTGAQVLPVVIRGTPACERAFESFLRPSSAVVRFLPIRGYPKDQWDATGIARDLEEQAARELGWVRTGRAATET